MSDYEMSDVFVSAIDDGQKFLSSPAGQLHTLASTLPDSDPVKGIIQEHISPAQPQVPVADDSGLNFIKKQEGFYAKAYGDYKQYSIGYGTRARFPGETITREDAEIRLKDETSRVSEYIRNTIKVPLTQNQHNALVSFGYNVGTGGIGSLARDINAGNHEMAAQRMLSWNRAGGQVLPGLVSRRQAESQMYMSDAPVSIGAPSDYSGLPYQRMTEAPKEKTPGVLDATVEFLGSFQNTIKAVGGATKPSQRSDYRLGDYTA